MIIIKNYHLKIFNMKKTLTQTQTQTDVSSPSSFHQSFFLTLPCSRVVNPRGPDTCALP